MERSPEVRRARPLTAIISLGGIALMTGCGYGYEVVAGKPVEIIEENSTTRYVSGTEHDRPHYEEDYSFIIRQCDRGTELGADDDGCMYFAIPVTEEMALRYEPGDVIVFPEDRRVSLLEEK